MIKYSDALSKVQLVELNQICGEGNVLFKTEDKEVYGSDETEDFYFVPAVVVKPANAEEISAILKLANREKIPGNSPRCRYRTQWWSPACFRRNCSLY